MRKVNPSAYAQTSHISLVSSFVPSIFFQRIAPIEVSYASGMSVVNVLTSKWEDCWKHVVVPNLSWTAEHWERLGRGECNDGD